MKYSYCVSDRFCNVDISIIFRFNENFHHSYFSRRQFTIYHGNWYDFNWKHLNLTNLYLKKHITHSNETIPATTGDPIMRILASAQSRKFDSPQLQRELIRHSFLLFTPKGARFIQLKYCIGKCLRPIIYGSSAVTVGVHPSLVFI